MTFILMVANPDLRQDWISKQSINQDNKLNTEINLEKLQKITLYHHIHILNLTARPLTFDYIEDMFEITVTSPE